MSMVLVKISGDLILEMPDFIHEYGDKNNHTYKGSLKRHVTVEKILYKISWWLTDNDAMPVCKLFDAVLDILFGLNCNFPKRDIALYFVWYLQGCKPISVHRCNR